MKILKKINKGLILTIIVLSALTIYLISVEKQREEDKIDIENSCKEFIEFTSKYLILPEDRQKIGENVEIKDDDEYLKEMHTELEELMIDNENAVDVQYEVLRYYLSEGYNSSETRTKLDRNLTKISSYEFDGDQVTIHFGTRVEEENKYIDTITNKELSKNDTFYTSGDEMILQKVEGEWKIVYINMQITSDGGYYVRTSNF